MIDLAVTPTTYWVLTETHRLVIPGLNSSLSVFLFFFSLGIFVTYVFRKHIRPDTNDVEGREARVSVCICKRKIGNQHECLQN